MLDTFFIVPYSIYDPGAQPGSGSELKGRNPRKRHKDKKSKINSFISGLRLTRSGSFIFSKIAKKKSKYLNNGYLNNGEI